VFIVLLLVLILVVDVCVELFKGKGPFIDPFILASTGRDVLESESAEIFAIENDERMRGGNEL